MSDKYKSAMAVDNWGSGGSNKLTLWFPKGSKGAIDVRRGYESSYRRDFKSWDNMLQHTIVKPEYTLKIFIGDEGDTDENWKYNRDGIQDVYSGIVIVNRSIIEKTRYKHSNTCWRDHNNDTWAFPLFVGAQNIKIDVENDRILLLDANGIFVPLQENLQAFFLIEEIQNFSGEIKILDSISAFSFDSIPQEELILLMEDKEKTNLGDGQTDKKYNPLANFLNDLSSKDFNLKKYLPVLALVFFGLMLIK